MAITNHYDHLIGLGAAVSCDSKRPLRASGCAAMGTVLTLPLPCIQGRPDSRIDKQRHRPRPDQSVSQFSSAQPTTPWSTHHPPY